MYFSIASRLASQVNVHHLNFLILVFKLQGSLIALSSYDTFIKSFTTKQVMALKIINVHLQPLSATSHTTLNSSKTVSQSYSKQFKKLLFKTLTSTFILQLLQNRNEWGRFTTITQQLNILLQDRQSTQIVSKLLKVITFKGLKNPMVKQEVGQMIIKIYLFIASWPLYLVSRRPQKDIV